MSFEGRTVLLLDLDGVLLDNDQWGAEWERLAASTVTPVLELDTDIWLRHHQSVFMQVWQRANEDYQPKVGLRRRNMARWWDRVHASWIVEMCELAGIEPPRTFEEQVDASERIHTAFLLDTQAIFPGSAGAITDLSGHYQIHMASGNPSWIVEAALERLGIRNLVGHAFGSDLAAVQKGHPDFYPTILRTIGVTGDKAMVVDDGSVPLSNAARAGILPIGIGNSDQHEGICSVPTIAQLPELIL